MIPASPVGDCTEEETARRLAALARLELSPEEARALGGQLAGLLQAFRALESVSVEGVAPMLTPADGEAGTGGLRADRPVPGLAREALLASAPRTAGDPPRFFRAPSAIATPEPEA